VRKLRIMRRG